MREKVILVCTVCLSRNYRASKKEQGDNKRMEVTKHCPKCNSHTIHKESR
jgi:large subunit ribosomal protein L33